MVQAVHMLTTTVRRDDAPWGRWGANGFAGFAQSGRSFNRGRVVSVWRMFCLLSRAKRSVYWTLCYWPFRGSFTTETLRAQRSLNLKRFFGMT
jgi:hypothetical protein